MTCLHVEQDDLADIVRAAQRGDERAWSTLVATWSPMLRGVVRRYGLNAHDVDDVVQDTWMRAFRKLHTLSAPEAAPAWLATIARRAAMLTLQIGTREVLVDDVPERHDTDERGVEDLVADAQRDVALRRAVRRLPEHERRIIAALLSEPAASYRGVAQRLDIPVGSIGPTRARSLTRLQRDPVLTAAIGTR
ncbi:MAG TPA: sigma-70 family RNA polymerase sigma factor [Solirubrobacter sp.]